MARLRKRKGEILEVASTVMRRCGVLNTRLQDVAEELGVAYTALYHYFRSRDELAAEVLAWNIELRARQLEEAEGESALDRLLDFMRRDIVHDREKKVRVPPPTFLPKPHRQIVSAAQEKLTGQIAALLSEGIEEGSIVECDTALIAGALVHSLEYFVAFDSNTAPSLRDLSAEQIATYVTDIYRRGVLAGEREIPTPSYTIDSPLEVLLVDPSVDAEIERLESLYRVATTHFNAEGAQASIPRMAADLGISKTVFYQYFLDKEELLYRCYERGANVVEASHHLAEMKGVNPLDEILIHRFTLYYFHAGEAGPFSVQNALGQLKPQHRRVIMLKNLGVREVSTRRLRRGIESGALRDDFNADIAQPMIGQLIYNVSQWYSPERFDLTIEEVCRQTFVLNYGGLEPR